MFLFFLLVIVNSQLFAGNGMSSTSYTIDDKIIVMDCKTYDDCYSLFCIFLYDPTFYFTSVKANYWNGDCNKLNIDNRTLVALFDTYYHDKIDKEYVTNDMTDVSKLLCLLNRNTNISQIQYLYVSCHNT
jgi:hypothetical protein